MEKKREKLKLVGTRNQVAFIWDMLACGDSIWRSGTANIVIELKKGNSLKVQKAIYEMLKKRKELKIF